MFKNKMLSYMGEKIVKACKVAAVFSVGKSIPCLPRRMLVSRTFKFIGTNLGREIFVLHSCARASHLAKE